MPTLTSEHKAKLLAANIGNQHALGHKHSDAIRAALSDWAKQRYDTPEGFAFLQATSKIRTCIRWNINRGKPCTCGKHLEKGEPV